MHVFSWYRRFWNLLAYCFPGVTGRAYYNLLGATGQTFPLFNARYSLVTGVEFCQVTFFTKKNIIENEWLLLAAAFLQIRWGQRADVRAQGVSVRTSARGLSTRGRPRADVRARTRAD